MRADIQAYLESWSSEIDARKNRVRQLIGDAHWLSDGHHKESILREFFSNYLPKDLSIGRGFVKTTRDLTQCSPEVDILISDPSLNPPLFSEGDLQIVDSSSLVGQIEVKTTLNKRNLVDALCNVSRTQALIGNYSDADAVWKGIFFYTTHQSMNIKRLLDLTATTISDSASQLRSRANACEFIAPTCIAALDGYCCFLIQESARQVAVKVFDLGSLSFPCAIADMFSAIRRRRGGAVVSGLDNAIETLNVPAPFTREILL